MVGNQAKNPKSHIVWVFVHMPEPIDTESRAQIAEIGKSTPSYHVLTSNEVLVMYEKKEKEKNDNGPIVFQFYDIQFNKDQWFKVRNALSST